MLALDLDQFKTYIFGVSSDSRLKTFDFLYNTVLKKITKDLGLITKGYIKTLDINRTVTRRVYIQYIGFKNTVV